jgi:hypothetical protein
LFFTITTLRNICKKNGNIFTSDREREEMTGQPKKKPHTHIQREIVYLVLYCSPNIIMAARAKRIRRAGFIAGVGIATGYGFDDRGVGVRVPVVSRIFSSLRRPDQFWGPLSLLSNGSRGKAAGE